MNSKNNINKLNSNVKKLNLYCSFFGSIKKSNIEKIKTEINKIKVELNNIENLL